MWFALFQALTVDRAQRHVWKYTSTGFVCLAVICTAIAMIWLSTTMHRHFSEQQQYIDDIQKQQQTILCKQNKMNHYDMLSRTNLEAFIEFQKHRFYEFFTIEELKDRLINLQKKLKIESINVQHKPPILVQDGVSTTLIDIDLKVMHDRQFFQFLEHVQKSNMGFFMVKSFDLKRIENKKKPPTFQGNMTLQWFSRQS